MKAFVKYITVFLLVAAIIMPSGTLCLFALEEPSANQGAEGTQGTGSNAPSDSLPGTQIPGTQIPGTQIPGTQIPGTQIPGTQIPGTDNTGTGGTSSDTPETDPDDEISIDSDRDPQVYVIKDEEDFSELAALVAGGDTFEDKKVYLINDITLDGVSVAGTFKGYFNGLGKTIILSNMTSPLFEELEGVRSG